MRRGVIYCGVALVLLLTAMGWSHWRGAQVPALEVRWQPLQQWVVASGQVRNQSLARIGSEITGTVTQRHVREGDAVQAGDLLISLRSDELQAQYEQAQTALAQLHNQLYPQAKQSVQEAKLAWQQAVREAQRRSKLAEQGMISVELAEQARHLAQTQQTVLNRAELAEQSLRPGGDEERLLQQRLANARASLDKTQIKALFAGKVQTRNVEPGDQVQPGRVLLELARRDGLEIIAAVDEKYLAPLQVGQQAVVIADAWPEQELPAHISFLAPAVDENTGTLDVHLQVDDSQQLLRLGMTVSVSIITASKPQALVVPRDYLQRDADGWYVLLVQEQRAHKQRVRLGLQTGTRVELLDGVAEGDLLLLPEHLHDASRRVRVQSVQQSEVQD